VKRTVALTAGVLALGTLAYMGTRMLAQTPAGQARPAAPQTKVAILNINYVIKYYEKYKNFQNDIKNKAKEYESKIIAKNNEIEKLSKDAAAASDPAKREQLEKQAKQLAREKEDLTMEGRKILAKQGADLMVIIYKEVREAAQRHAVANGFDLVLHYEEAITTEEFDSPQNIHRKLNAGGLIPLYWSQGMDISVDVLKALNASYRPAPAPAGK